MPTDPQRNSVETQPVSTSGTGIPPPAYGTATAGGPDEFLSLRDILIMILRHRWAIFLFVILVTLAAGIFFINRPRSYTAEGYLQVILPLSSEGRVDKELFETMIASHLQKASSAYIARNVSALLNDQGLKITPLALEKQIKITRPPKTDLIRMVAWETSADEALLIVRLWVREYLASIQKNNIYAALSQSRLLLKQAQSELMERQATVDKMKVQVAQSSPLVTLSRAVDDRQIWNDLTQKAAPDPEALKKLSAIHIKGQEQSEEYINLKMALLTTDQALSAILARRNLYQEVVRILETKIASNGSFIDGKLAPTNAAPSEAEFYVNTLMKSSEIVQFGEPGLISAARGALKKTGLFFIASLALACFGAFMCEWCKGLLSSR
ncbi:MAG: hypothetical protein KJ964_03820 [Verrucomicrobia bacterium]|nr:hypothetical protein [Verrucomicrobiota bacterium]MBU1734887.1 hypothetical protein [Verrucomicrobiota bacterium]MBU1856988.1 hypothetical protein [Verrucomicrobiota bacterium]